MRKICHIFFMAFLACGILAGTGCCQPHEDSLIKLSQDLEGKTRFNREQVEGLMNLLACARNEGVNTNSLENRVREGIAKKAKFASIYEVVEEKVKSLRAANDWIGDYIRLGMKYDNRDYCVDSLSLMIEKEFSQTNFRAIANLVLLRKMKVEDTVALSKLLSSRDSDKQVKEIIIYGLLENQGIEDITDKVEKKSKPGGRKFSLKRLLGIK